MRLYGLIGWPLAHSFSKKYFTEKFKNENLPDVAYELFPMASVREFPALLKARPKLCGLNVTLPYKEQVVPFLDDLSEEAAAIGAVNTILFTSDGLIGYNTDAYGFRQSLTPFLKPHHKKALVLGTGGASKAVQYVLENADIQVSLVSRKAPSGRLTYRSLNEQIIQAHTLIVNATPLGTWPHVKNKPDLPYRAIGTKHVLYDLVYNPAETAFMQAGRAKGATVVNGLDMLKMQAEMAWEIFSQSCR